MIAAEAPANIALIKYMGKLPGTDAISRNRPTNASLSLTLPHLRTRVEISELDGPGADVWQPLVAPGWQVSGLSERGLERYLRHFAMLKDEWKLSGRFLVRSGNNFPSDCGLASSASSFAALTMATARLAQERQPELDLVQDQIAEMSRRGSGSSIRSFYGPFCQWDHLGVREVEMGEWRLQHLVVVVEKEKKAVSSSEAHQRVATSPLFEGRPERAEQRLEDLKLALRSRDWRRAFTICWDEFHDMHALFSTSRPPFSYMTKGTHEVLNELEELWRERDDGPLVTMDAGANVHLLFREDQKTLREDLSSHFAARFEVFG